MKVLIDSAIPYINGVLEPFATVSYKKGSEITASDVTDCDALIIRTRTHCNESLLKQSKVRFIGTATIGYDHIDLNYCKSHSIHTETAAGCNAMGVVQYVMAAILELEKIRPVKTVGIIGVGNVGKAAEQLLSRLGYRVLLNDPPRAVKEPNFQHTELNTLLSESDLITLHVPLDATTRNLASTSFFEQMKEETFFINASRGEVVDETALLSAMEHRKVIYPVLDVWCNEPTIHQELCQKAFIATPHIAGYSEQGKANGTAMMVNAFAHYFNIKELHDWYPKSVEQADRSVERSKEEIRTLMPRYYDLFSDSNALKMNNQQFEELRNSYKYRKEFF